MAGCRRKAVPSPARRAAPSSSIRLTAPAPLSRAAPISASRWPSWRTACRWPRRYVRRRAASSTPPRQALAAGATMPAFMSLPGLHCGRKTARRCRTPERFARHRRRDDPHQLGCAPARADCQRAGRRTGRGAAKNDWDLAAGHLILTEAGGHITGADGAGLHYGRGVYCQPAPIAAGPVLHALLLERLALKSEESS